VVKLDPLCAGRAIVTSKFRFRRSEGAHEGWM
jgi:hypothetical protein